jgi:hypothetical protein
MELNLKEKMWDDPKQDGSDTRGIQEERKELVRNGKGYTVGRVLGCRLI